MSSRQELEINKFISDADRCFNHCYSYKGVFIAQTDNITYLVEWLVFLAAVGLIINKLQCFYL